MAAASARSYLVAFAGGSCAGKSTLVETLMARLPAEKTALLCQDSYYKDQTHVPIPERYTEVNYDHPDAFDIELFIEHLRALRSGKSVNVPVFDYTPCQRLPETVLLSPRPIVFVDGILILHDDRLRNLLDFIVYVDVPSDIRLLRRVKRDSERGMEMPEILEMYHRYVHPMHDLFIEPFKHLAHLVIPNHGAQLHAKSVDVLFDHLLAFSPPARL